jgi:glutaredoxin-like protein NrdH
MSIDMKHIDGKNVGNVVLYALSTCGWCKKVKRLLNDLAIEYDYVDVDLLDGNDREEIEKEIKRWNPHCSFPTIVMNQETCVVGFKEEQIKEILSS